MRWREAPRQHLQLSFINDFCCILDVSNRPFSIAIKDSVTVDDLKDAILKKKRRTGFAKVDPDELTLWKVCGFLCFDQLLGYIPLSQGIYHDRQEPQEESGSIMKTRCHTPIVENLSPP